MHIDVERLGVIFVPVVPVVVASAPVVREDRQIMDPVIRVHDAE
jgi:hypothetical protein